MDTNGKEPNQESNNDEEKSHSSDHHDTLSNPISYAALNFCMDLKEEIQTNEREIVEETLGRLRSLTTKKAFEIWIEDLAKQVEDFLQQKLNHTLMINANDLVNKDPYVSSKKNHAAAIQIENPLCTHRESSLSSTAWTKAYRNQLKSRPTYTVLDLDSSDHEHTCEACGRNNHNVAYKVMFGGNSYDASRTYEILKKTRHTDWERCLRSQRIQYDSNDEDDSNLNLSSDDDGQRNETSHAKEVFKVGKYCRARSELYHSLLHYKYKVFSHIGMKLLGVPVMDYYGNLKQKVTRTSGRIKLKTKVKDLVKDTKFLNEEYEKYQKLIQLAAEGWSFGVMEKNLDSTCISWSGHQSYEEDVMDVRNENKKKLEKQRKKLKKVKKKLRKHKKRMKKEMKKKKAKEKILDG